jgi:uncharacterized membrane protein YqiK
MPNKKMVEKIKKKHEPPTIFDVLDAGTYETDELSGAEEVRLKAEAEEALRQAEAEKAKAQRAIIKANQRAQKARAEAQKARTEAEMARAEAEKVEIMLKELNNNLSSSSHEIENNKSSQ